MQNLFSQPSQLIVHGAALQRFGDNLEQLLNTERLGKLIVGTLFHSFYSIVDTGIAGDDEHLRCRPQLSGGLQNFHSSFAFHPQIGNDQIHLLMLQQADRFFSIFSQQGKISFSPEDMRQVFTHYFFIINNENSFGLLFCSHYFATPFRTVSGSSMKKEAPSPALLTTLILP